MSSELDIQPEGKIRVLILAGPDPIGDWMASAIRFEPDIALLACLQDMTQARESVDHLSPDVLLVDVSSGIVTDSDLIQRVSTPVPTSAVIVVATMDEVEIVRQAMLQGAKGFLLKPFSEADLLKSIQQAHALILRQRAELARIPEEPGAVRPETLPKADVVAVFSPKGGVGCTTIAVNLAVALETVIRMPTILVDGDLRFGDVDAALNMPAGTSVGTLAPSLDEFSNQELDRALVVHESGIKVLTAPPYLDAADSIQPAHFKLLLRRLSALRPGFVVVDTWSSLDDITLAILDSCQHLIVVTTPQIMALRDTHRFLEVLELLEFDPDQVMLVVNHCYQRSSLQPRDVERALNRPIDQVIEHTPLQVTASLNRGVPLILDYRDSPAARGILSLARQLGAKQIVPEDQQTAASPEPRANQGPRRRGLFSRD
jgi:pilus assembly protein CpaE